MDYFILSRIYNRAVPSLLPVNEAHQKTNMLPGLQPSTGFTFNKTNTTQENPATVLSGLGLNILILKVINAILFTLWKGVAGTKL